MHPWARGATPAAQVQVSSSRIIPNVHKSGRGCCSTNLVRYETCARVGGLNPALEHQLSVSVRAYTSYTHVQPVSEDLQQRAVPSHQLQHGHRCALHRVARRRGRAGA